MKKAVSVASGVSAIALTAIAVALGATSLNVTADPFKNAYNKRALQASPGKVTITMVNQGFTGHNVAIRAGTTRSSKIIAKGPVVLRGSTSKVTATLKRGRYRFLCTFEGHEASGMWGILTVK
jgi:plastocyanin